MDLRHRPVDPPPRPHLAPMQDVLLLHARQVSHISTFSPNRIYRTLCFLSTLVQIPRPASQFAGESARFCASLDKKIRDIAFPPHALLVGWGARNLTRSLRTGFQRCSQPVRAAPPKPPKYSLRRINPYEEVRILHPVPGDFHP